MEQETHLSTQSMDSADTNNDFTKEEYTKNLVKEVQFKLNICDLDENIEEQDFEDENFHKTNMDVDKVSTKTDELVKSIDLCKEEYKNTNVIQADLSPKPSCSNICDLRDYKVNIIEQDFSEEESNIFIKGNESLIQPDFGTEELTNAYLYSTINKNQLEVTSASCNHNLKKVKKRKRQKFGLTNKEMNNLGVVIKRADGVSVSKELATVIRSRLSKHIWEAIENEVDSDKLNFINSGLVDNGYFLVTSANEKSRDWLLSCNLGSYDNVAIKSYRKIRTKKKVKLPKSPSVS